MWTTCEFRFLALVFYVSALLCNYPGSALAHPGSQRTFSFDQAKKRLYSQVPFKLDFYCGCPVSGTKIDFGGCTFQDGRKAARSSRIEAEHIVPASLFGRAFKEYRLGHKDCRTKKGVLYSGRQCLLKISKEYRVIHNDLYNLYPTIGSVNGTRSNLPYCCIDGEQFYYQGCDFEVVKDTCIEPRIGIRGYIARTYQYMAWRYPERVVLSEEVKSLMQQWDSMHPVTENECEIDAAIAKVQGNRSLRAEVCEKFRATIK